MPVGAMNNLTRLVVQYVLTVLAYRCRWSSYRLLGCKLHCDCPGSSNLLFLSVASSGLFTLGSSNLVVLAFRRHIRAKLR